MTRPDDGDMRGKATKAFTVNVAGAAPQLAKVKAMGLPARLACSVLSSFISQVNAAVAGKSMTPAQAGGLTIDARRIRTVLGCK